MHGEIPNHPPSTGRTRDEEFDFGDGSLILAVQGVEFRVHISILSRYSPVFKDMTVFGTNSMATGVEATMQTPSPVVELQDSARDWRHVLRAVYQAHPLSRLRDVNNPESWCPDFDTLAAYIRLGNKYQMDELHNPAMEYVEGYFSPTFETWKEVNRRDHIYTLPGCAPECAIGIVNLARLVGNTSLLPLALLCCSQLGRKLLDGFVYRDGEHETLRWRTLRSASITHGDRVHGSGTMHDAPCATTIERMTNDFHLEADWRHPVSPTPFVQPDLEMICDSCRDSIAAECDAYNRGTSPRWSHFLNPKLKITENWWFNDGTLILIVEDVEFRVYHGILARHSPVFKDMLSSPGPHQTLARPPDFSDTTVVTEGGIPAVALEDSARDWWYVLGALMGGHPASRVWHSQTAMLTSEELFAFVRLGHKYQIDALYQPGVDLLKHHFPARARVGGPHVVAEAHALGFDAAHALGVANLARLTGEVALLPALLQESGYAWLAEKSLSCYMASDRLAADPFLEGVELREDWKGTAKEVGGEAWSGVVRRLDEARENVWGILPSLFGIEVMDWNARPE
ncbi:uncharacterized protein BXZ73DRAFT_103210 [Epithele typhae]|uniref:uncharacterized protein n=1 Tax=Epithele typhae TaxID=378194 RepID=UPI0020075FE9|nr:uncharacterized protein BXZ73DRAFT_103210 [Epithele typhae]KAH9925682.1 hypothetical protein BXZ73DRAFT_103210 [Epithele typhae]